jgi:hypothetical protein
VRDQRCFRAGGQHYGNLVRDPIAWEQAHSRHVSLSQESRELVIQPRVPRYECDRSVSHWTAYVDTRHNTMDLPAARVSPLGEGRGLLSMEREPAGRRRPRSPYRCVCYGKGLARPEPGGLVFSV